VNDILPALPSGDVRAINSFDPLGNSANGNAPQEFILRQYWRILLKRRWLIIGIVAACLAIGVALALTTQREYSATVSLEVAREAAKVVDLQNTRVSAGADQEFYQTQYTLLQSRSLAEAVVRDLRLADDMDFLTGYTGDDASKVKQAPRKAREEMATSIVMAGTEVIPVRLSSIVTVRYSSPKPEMAAKVANALADNFIKSNLARRYDATAYARNFLETRLEQVRKRLEESERQAVAYAGQQGIISLGNPAGSNDTSGGQSSPEGQSLAAADLTGLNAALVDARTKRIQAQSRYEEAKRSGGRGLAEVSSNAAINSLREQRAVLQGQYQNQSANLGPDYPSQVALRRQISELDRQIASETSRVSSTVESDYREALQVEEQLQARVDGLKTSVMDLRRRSIQYNIYQRDVDTNRTLYNALLQQYKEAGIAGGVGTNNVSIVDPAQVPDRPFKPNLRLNVLLSILIGLILGGLAALVMEQLAESAIMPEEFHEKLGVPLLGTIPLLTKDEQAIDVLQDRKSPVSEAYFSVYTGLQFVTTHGTPRSLFVTSTQPSEGKSTTAMAIAMSIARVGRRVLLIDADMRNPSVHKQFGVTNEEGLSNVLVDSRQLSDVTHNAIIPTFFYMTAGHIPPNPAELLSGGTFNSVLAEALALFDHVVVDGPPVMGLADAPLIGSIAEATVFIMESGRTRATQARRALDRLNAVGTPVVGAVLTKFDNKREGYGYGYGYEYSYGK
jgi:succinoglycan biosynthesis transport protein ExoP